MASDWDNLKQQKCPKCDGSLYLIDRLGIKRYSDPVLDNRPLKCENLKCDFVIMHTKFRQMTGRWAKEAWGSKQSKRLDAI